jgi:DNA-binding GntR family transcriptional regulator
MMARQASTGTANEAIVATADDTATASHIVDSAVRAILEHRLPPGAKLSESALCEAFAAGRSTVRRALLMLAERGIVTLEANRGAFVACPSTDDARAVFEARRVIEPSIAIGAARALSSRNLSVLKSQLRKEANAHRSGAHHEAIRLSGEFHVALAQSQGNPLLSRFVAELVARTSLIIGLFGSPGRTHCLCDDHWALIDALAAREGAKASRLMFDHLCRIEANLDMRVRIGSKVDVVAVLRG